MPASQKKGSPVATIGSLDSRIRGNDVVEKEFAGMAVWRTSSQE